MKTRFTRFSLITALFICVLLGNSFAQSSSWQWAKGAGSTGGEMATGTALDASGNLYTVGWYTSANITFGATTLVNPGNFTSDIFVVKTDASGVIVWAKTFGGTDGDLGNGITVDQSGNIYITGWYSSATMTMGSHTLTNAASGSSDMFIGKLDPAGNTIWAKSIGGSAADRGYGIAVDLTGNVFTTGGFSSGSVSFGSNTLTNGASGTNDIFVAKFDTNGNPVWAKSAGGSNADQGYSAATDSSGNVYVTGAFSSSAINFGTGALANSSAGTQDLFVIKYNGSGTAVWSARSGGSFDDFGNGIAVSKNNIYVTGGFNSSSIAFGSNTLTNSSAGTCDILLANYDDIGNVIWAKRAGGTDSEAANGITVSSAQNIFITGYFTSSSLVFAGSTLTNFMAGYRDLFLASYDGSGSPLWGVAAGESYDETSNSISVNAAGTEVYIGGTFNSGVVSFGAYNVYKGCGDDVFIAKLLSPAVGIMEKYLADEKAVYPNPTSGKFKIAAEGEIEFFNMMGEQILEREVTRDPFNQNEFDFSEQPKGVYFFRIFSDKKLTAEGKVTIQ
jgi:hypothetical protein